MKNFIFTILFLIHFPSFAQQCEEGDIQLINEGNVISLHECRSGVFNHLLGRRAEGFLEAHRYDVTFASRMAVLSGCEFENCLRISQTYQTVTLTADPNNPTEVEYLNYFAERYRAWSARAFNDIIRTVVIPTFPPNVIKCNALPPEASEQCWTFECEGIDDRIALQPSSLQVKGSQNQGGISGHSLEVQGSLRSFIYHRRVFNQPFPEWILAPLGVAYNRDGNCNGPFDQNIR